MIVLDASVVLAVLLRDEGSETLAEALAATLLTRDRKLAATPGLRAAAEVV